MKVKLIARMIVGFFALTSFWSKPVHAQTNLAQFAIVSGKIPNDTLEHAIRDLRAYLSKSVPRSKTVLLTAGTKILSKGTIIVLVDEKDAALIDLAKSYGLSPEMKEWNSFKISSFRQKGKPSNLIYFLQGADAMGKQYAVYDLIERLLGVRYLRPDDEHVPVHAHFKPAMINTGLEKPDYRWRGLYPWNYNYNRRGLTTFCDINARFENKDWAWYRKLGDWMVKNKQNAFLWFDDVFSYKTFPASFRMS